MIAPAAPMAPPHVSPWTAALFLLQGRITALQRGPVDEAWMRQHVLPLLEPSS